LGESSFCGQRMPLPFEEEQRAERARDWKLDMKDIIRRAMLTSQKSGMGDGQIDISHLNPLKSIKAYMAGVAHKHSQARQKLMDLDQLVSREIKLVEYSPVRLESLTDEQIVRVSRNTAMKPHPLSTISTTSVVETLATLKNPQNIKIKRYNQSLNLAIAQVTAQSGMLDQPLPVVAETMSNQSS